MEIKVMGSSKVTETKATIKVKVKAMIFSNTWTN